MSRTTQIREKTWWVPWCGISGTTDGSCLVCWYSCCQPTAPGATSHTAALVVRHSHLVHRSGWQVFFFYFIFGYSLVNKTHGSTALNVEFNLQNKTTWSPGGACKLKQAAEMDWNSSAYSNLSHKHVEKDLREWQEAGDKGQRPPL